MRIGRTLTPAATPIYLKNLLSGLCGWSAGSSEIERFQSEIKKVANCKFAFIVSSGQAALWLVLQALKPLFPDRTDIIVPAFTCFSVPAAIKRAGLRIRPCDIDPQTLDVNVEALDNIFTEYYLRSKTQHNKEQTDEHPLGKPLAVIPTYLFGLRPDITKHRAYRQKFKTVIIADAAQTFPFPKQITPLDEGADVAIYSLGRGKALSTVQGGVIVTNRADIAASIEITLKKIPAASKTYLFNNIGSVFALICFMNPKFYWLPKLLPFLKLGETVFDEAFPIYSFTPFQAGMTRHWITQLNRNRLCRNLNANYWKTNLGGNNIKKFQRKDLEHAEFIRYPIRITDSDKREQIIRKSDQLGLGIMSSYPTSIGRIPELKTMLEGANFPQADRTANELITLPVHNYVNRMDRIKIIKIINEAFLK